MAEIVLDTSAWVDLLAHRVPVPTAIMGRRRVVTATICMAELASLAERGRIEAESVAHVLDHSRLEEPTVDDFVAAGLLHGRLRNAGHGKVSLVDCIAYEVARRLGAPYLTRDQDLAGQPGVLTF